MEDKYRKPEIKKENGFCSIQNGTYIQVPNKDAWACMAPVLDMLKPSKDFYKLIESGCENDVKNLLLELRTLSSQIGNVVTRIKKANRKFMLPDMDYFAEKFNAIYQELADIPYKEAKRLKKERAHTLAEEFRQCIKICIAHNYNEAVFLDSVGMHIEIPEEELHNMQQIANQIAIKQNI